VTAVADPVEALGERLGYRFRDRGLIGEALTHASWAYEHPPASHNGRLAFLGDAVLALVVAERVMAERPGEPVGVLTPRRADLVSGANLARWAELAGLPPLLRLGRGEEQSGGQGKESVLATAFEAVLAVVYLEAGLDGVRRVVASVALW
jgi:ribonuclease-3